MAIATQSGFRVTVTGGNPVIPGTWGTFEGGAMTRTYERAWVGDGSYTLTAGRPIYDDITVTRPYDPAKDDLWMNQLRRNIDNGDPTSYNVLKQAVGQGNSSVGKPESYPNCMVINIRTASVAAGSEATPATIELVLATKGPAN